MNIQRKNSAHHFRMQSEREQTLVNGFSVIIIIIIIIRFFRRVFSECTEAVATSLYH